MTSNTGGGDSNERCQALLGEVFRDVFDDDSIVLRADMTARDIDGWDSMAHVRLILSIERKYQVRFSALEVGVLQSVGALAALVERKAPGRV